MSEWCKEVAHGDRETSPTPYPAYFEAVPLPNATIAATASAEPYGAHTRPMWMIEDRGTASGESARPAERDMGAWVAADSSRPSAGCRSSTRAVRKRMPAEWSGARGRETLWKSACPGDRKCGPFHKQARAPKNRQFPISK